MSAEDILGVCNICGNEPSFRCRKHFVERIAELTDLVQRMRAWDMFNPPTAVSDGPYWAGQIDRVLGRTMASVSEVFPANAVEASIERKVCGTCGRSFPVSTEVAICRCDGTFVTEAGVQRTSEAWTSTALLRPEEIAYARAADKIWVDANGMGFVDPAWLAAWRENTCPLAGYGGRATRCARTRDHAGPCSFEGGEPCPNEATCGAKLAAVSQREVTCERDTGHEGSHASGGYQWPRLDKALPAMLRACLNIVVAGGTLVSSNECSETEIATANACNRFYVDDKALGYVARPKRALPVGDGWAAKLARFERAKKAWKEITGEDVAHLVSPPEWPPMPAWATADADDDRPLAEDTAIDAAFPTRSERHDLYAESMRLVGARRSKGGLVALANWLLHRAEKRTDYAMVTAEELAGGVGSNSFGHWSEVIDDLRAMNMRIVRTDLRSDSATSVIRAYAVALGIDQPDPKLLHVARTIVALLDDTEIPEYRSETATPEADELGRLRAVERAARKAHFGMRLEQDDRTKALHQELGYALECASQTGGDGK